MNADSTLTNLENNPFGLIQLKRHGNGRYCDDRQDLLNFISSHKDEFKRSVGVTSLCEDNCSLFADY